jgi:hypothetical protein
MHLNGGRGKVCHIHAISVPNLLGRYHSCYFYLQHPGISLNGPELRDFSTILSVNSTYD